MNKFACVSTTRKRCSDEVEDSDDGCESQKACKEKQHKAPPAVPPAPARRTSFQVRNIHCFLYSLLIKY